MKGLGYEKIVGTQFSEMSNESDPQHFSVSLRKIVSGTK